MFGHALSALISNAPVNVLTSHPPLVLVLYKASASAAFKPQAGTSLVAAAVYLTSQSLLSNQ